MKKISVITVNYNQARVTEQFLASVLEKSNGDYLEIIVVDNGSDEDPTVQWKEKFDTVHIIRSEKNLGFAGGNNLGIRRASGEYLFFANNDTEFTNGLVEILAGVLDVHPYVGVVSPKIRYFNNPAIIQYAGFTPMDFKTGRNKCLGNGETDKGQYDRPAGPTGYAHGAAMMVRKTVINQAGLMPEVFFLYYEEMDWCEQIRNAGYGIWIAPEAIIYHKESVSVGKMSPLKEYFMTRNRILFIRRNASLLQTILFFLHFSFFVTPRNLFSYYRHRRFDLTRQFLRAIWWNLTHKKISMDFGYAFKRVSA